MVLKQTKEPGEKLGILGSPDPKGIKIRNMGVEHESHIDNRKEARWSHL